MVTDQLEALQVRVRRGIEVFDQRIRAGLRVARRRAAVLLATAVAGLSLLGLHVFASEHGIFRGGGFPARVLWLLATLAFLVALAAVPLCVLAFLDMRRLSRLRGRYTGEMERARSAEELLEFAEKVLDEARRLGMVPTSPASPGASRLPS
jgi:hypothetical protein